MALSQASSLLPPESAQDVTMRHLRRICLRCIQDRVTLLSFMTARVPHGKTSELHVNVTCDKDSITPRSFNRNILLPILRILVDNRNKLPSWLLLSTTQSKPQNEIRFDLRFRDTETADRLERAEQFLLSLEYLAPLLEKSGQDH